MPRGNNKIDETGKRFGRLLVQERVLPNDQNGGTRWRCLCTCGKVIVTCRSYLRRGSTRSCGCLQKETASGLSKSKVTHGLTVGHKTTVEYRMWASAKWRAKQQLVPFDIAPEDIWVPEVCPVMGIPLVRHVGIRGPHRDSPTLDKVDPAKGYIRGNVWVISHIANTCKQGLSISQLSILAKQFETGWVKYCKEAHEKTG